MTVAETKPLPSIEFPNSMAGDWVPCPKCHADADLAQRCGHCNMWGWVRANSPDATCLHEFVEIDPSEPWPCWHTYRCVKCGHQKSHDSSG